VPINWHRQEQALFGGIGKNFFNVSALASAKIFLKVSASAYYYRLFII
jgi:Na+-translocating ferredoxin:NAD+ oxidoreductase RnfD subunit